MKQMPVESFLSCVRQAGLARAIARTSRFVKLAERKQRPRKLRLVQPVQEVALVLGAVLGLQQLGTAPSTPRTRA